MFVIPIDVIDAEVKQIDIIVDREGNHGLIGIREDY